MKTYQIFVNGKNQGQVKTTDVEGFLNLTYPGVEASVNEEEKEIHFDISIMDAIMFSRRKRSDWVGRTGSITRRIKIIDVKEGNGDIEIRVEDSMGNLFWTTFDDDVSLD